MSRLKPSRLSQSIALLCIAAPLGALPSTASAQDVDLGNLGDRGFRIDGIATYDFSGRSVSGAGDVNGDGLADLIVGADVPGGGGVLYAGASYVVFGKASGSPVDLANLGAGGFRIDGIDSYDVAGFSVSGAGDVNGDGLADLVIGGPGASAIAGESYVVFGKIDTTPVDLAALGDGGFRIDGIDDGDRSGRSVSGAGDVNGDGLDDLIVGAPFADPGGDASAGESYVVFGKAGSSPIDLAALGESGFRIDGIAADDLSGFSVSGAGDVNGDGLADLIVGAYGAAPGGNEAAGRSFVVFGKASSTTVDLAALADGGFRIDGIDAIDGSGFSVAGAGDVNGDGLADLIIGASSADPSGDLEAGESYVVFGKGSSTPVDLATLGTGGFPISGIDVGDRSGFSVAGAGDVNGDGLADVIIGAPFADRGGTLDAGETYVVFGKTTNTPVDPAALGPGGFRIDGAAQNDVAGHSVSGAGDVNGDGLADLIIGAYRATPGGVPFAGRSYVVFGAAVPPLSITVGARSANGNPPRTAFGITGDGSNDSTPDARAWIDFANGNDLLMTASTERATLTRAAGAMPSPGANVSWRIQTTRRNWTSAELRLRYLTSELLTSDETALQIMYSPTAGGPFTALPSVVNPRDNTITATISQGGVFAIGLNRMPDRLFADGFE